MEYESPSSITVATAATAIASSIACALKSAFNSIMDGLIAAGRLCLGMLWVVQLARGAHQLVQLVKLLIRELESRRERVFEG